MLTGFRRRIFDIGIAVNRWAPAIQSLTGIGTVVIGIVGLAGLYYTAKALRATEKSVDLGNAQLIEQRRQFDLTQLRAEQDSNESTRRFGETLSKTEQSIKIANEQYAHSVQQTLIENRPWLTAVENARFVPDFEFSRFRQSFQNTGRTAAIHVRHDLYIRTVPRELGDYEVISLISAEDAARPLVNQGSVAPDRLLTSEYQYITSKDQTEINKIESNLNKTFVRIRILYEDSFGRKHHTYTCTLYHRGASDYVVYRNCPAGLDRLD